MTLTAIIVLVLIGIILILIEFLLIPGINVAGIAGIALLITAIVLSYKNFGTQIGHFILLGTILIISISMYYALKAKTWRRLSLDTVIDSKIENVKEGELKVGETGMTISRLAPMGKVLINDKYYEAQSKSGYIDQNVEIEIVRINQNVIIVDKHT